MPGRFMRERERVRDLFGRHVGREVAAAAERERPQLGGEGSKTVPRFACMKAGCTPATAG